jgi:hypothetical protein
MNFIFRGINNPQLILNWEILTEVCILWLEKSQKKNEKFSVDNAELSLVFSLAMVPVRQSTTKVRDVLNIKMYVSFCEIKLYFYFLIYSGPTISKENGLHFLMHCSSILLMTILSMDLLTNYLKYSMMKM